MSAESKRSAGIGVPLQRLVSLRIESLIADKHMVTAQANLDLAQGGKWRTDYMAWHGQIDAEIQSLFEQANEVAERRGEPAAERNGK